MMGRKEIFADFVNGIVYHGKRILKPEGLECISGQPGIIYEAASGKNMCPGAKEGYPDESGYGYIFGDLC